LTAAASPSSSSSQGSRASTFISETASAQWPSRLHECTNTRM
jgi:hypothetical protein